MEAISILMKRSEKGLQTTSNVQEQFANYGKHEKKIDEQGIGRQ